MKEVVDTSRDVELEGIKLMWGDCLLRMEELADNSVDLILCDLPYGTTACHWDQVIPFEPLWAHYKRVLKRNGAVVLTASQPFTTDLIMSNRPWFKYCWVWDKAQSGSFQNAKVAPLRITEDVCVFYDTAGAYNPIMTKGKMRWKGGGGKINECSGMPSGEGVYNDDYYPTNILRFPNCANKQDIVHPTQKPEALFEYLIRTYTNEGETVLDSCLGSGTTAVACHNTKRKCIGIEMDETYYNIAVARIREAQSQQVLF